MAAHSKLRKVENSSAGSKREGALSRYWMLALAIGAWAVMKLAPRPLYDRIVANRGRKPRRND